MVCFIDYYSYYYSTSKRCFFLKKNIHFYLLVSFVEFKTSGFLNLPTSIRASKVRPLDWESLCQADQAEMKFAGYELTAHASKKEFCQRTQIYDSYFLDQDQGYLQKLSFVSHLRFFVLIIRNHRV